MSKIFVSWIRQAPPIGYARRITMTQTVSEITNIYNDYTTIRLFIGEI
ncbi:MAG: hypothetical protein U0525_05395 [Patescibacteria group bacterium]